MNRFGEKLRQLRQHHHVTLKQLARELGYTTHSYISEIESGQKIPTAQFVLNLSRLFHISTDDLLIDELELRLTNSIYDKREIVKMRELPFVDRPPTMHEVEKFRLILSTYQDGTGMLKDKVGTLPGWRDFERSVAAAFGGKALETKGIYDVVIANPDHASQYGVSCKMRGTLGEVERKGRVSIEVSNASGEFWDAVKAAGLTQESYHEAPDIVGRILIELVEGWHNSVGLGNGGKIDNSRSFFLTLQWHRTTGRYQLFQYPIDLPEPTSLKWEVTSRRLVAYDQEGVLFEWYGLSGGQFKYYPLVKNALWQSEQFNLESLPTDLELGLQHKAKIYFPEKWARVG
jgi:transcriptional regulator with XRE-family HTH domain